MKKKNKKYVIAIVIIIIAVIITVISIPYIQAEKLTAEYGNEFKDLYVKNGFYQDIEYFKVLKYKTEKISAYYPNKEMAKEIEQDKESAVVLYVEENHSSCSIYIFSSKKDEWELEEWYTVWSYSGSADGTMWPFYP